MSLRKMRSRLDTGLDSLRVFFVFMQESKSQKRDSDLRSVQALSIKRDELGLSTTRKDIVQDLTSRKDQSDSKPVTCEVSHRA